MRSDTLPSFWAAYASLGEDIKRSARKTYRLWKQNPFHPSLRFKCINREENVWSVRITRGYRALGVFEEEKVAWYRCSYADLQKRLTSMHQTRRNGAILQVLVQYDTMFTSVLSGS